MALHFCIIILLLYSVIEILGFFNIENVMENLFSDLVH